MRRVALLLAGTLIASGAWAQTAPPPAPPAATPAPTPAASPDIPRQHGRWAQDYTGRQADPAVRFGTLPNGLRYAIMHNDTPSGAVSMRMLIGSGSLSERDDERGVAHYLEHMAFRGSANVPDGEVVHLLERQGLTFGADTNAGTTFDSTVYQFDFPKADQAAIDTGLMLFREIGGRLKIDPALVQAERGVILSEERLRASANLRALESQLALTLAGTGAENRLPIGTIDSINAATTDKLRRFYQANYRPENAVIVVVGAIDPAAIEAAIRDRFGDWRGVGAADPYPARPPQIGSVHARTYLNAAASEQLNVTWTRPIDPRADTEARQRDHFLRLIGLTALNLRLRDAALQPDAPFTGASIGANPVFGSAETTSLNIVPVRSRWREAIDAALTEQRVLARDGISAADIARVAGILRPTLQAQVDGAATRQNATLANAIVREANNDTLFTSPAQDLAEVTSLLASATPADVTTSFRQAFTGAGPLAFRASSDLASGGDAALSLALDHVEAKPLLAEAADAGATWPYQHFGPTGRIVRRVTAADGSTRITFANGALLSVKPTKYAADNVTVGVAFGQGLLGLAPSAASERWLLDSPAWLQGGTHKLTFAQVQRALEGHTVNARLTVQDRRFVLSANTRAQDLNFGTQLLAAYYSDAAFRADGVERVRAAYNGQLAAIDASTQATLQRLIGPATHGDDARWNPVPSARGLAGTPPTALPLLLGDALKTPPEIVVIGDVTVDQAVAAIASTFGALPKASLPRAPIVRTPIQPVAPQDLIDYHHGRADQGAVVQLWSTTDYYAAPADTYALSVARAMLSDRLVETVREKLGLTYSPFATNEEDLDLPGVGYILAGIEAPPERFDAFRQALDQQIAALARGPIDPDAFARAKTPLIAAVRKATESNGYWESRELRLLSDPRAEAVYRDQISGLEAVTPADVQRVLNRYVFGHKPLSIEVRSMPKPTATATPAPPTPPK